MAMLRSAIPLSLKIFGELFSRVLSQGKVYVQSPQRGGLEVQGTGQRIQQSFYRRHPGQGDEPHTIAPELGLLASDLQCQARLAAAAGTDQGEQAPVPAGQLHLTLWSDSGNVLDPSTGVEIRVEGDQAYARRGPRDWQEIDNFTGAFAPQGDFIAFLSAAQDVEDRGEETRAGVTFTRYTFRIDGHSYATYLREQLQQTLVEQGELPPGVSLDLPREYVNMTGEGELWVGTDGLPLRQILHLDFPPRPDEQDIYADVTVDFDFQTPPSPIAGLVSSPSLFRTLQQYTLGLVTVLLPLGLVLIAAFNPRSKKAYTGLILFVLVAMLLGPFLQSAQAAAFADRQAQRQKEQDERHQASAMERDLQSFLTQPDFDPHRNPLPEAGQPAPIVVTASEGDDGGSDVTECDADDPNDTDDDGLTLGYLDLYSVSHPVAPGQVITDAITLILEWTPSSDGSGLRGYHVGWTLSPTDTAGTVFVPAGTIYSVTQPAGEAQILYAHIVTVDQVGNHRHQVLGPIYVDAPSTPDITDLGYHGWMDSGCAQLGLNRRIPDPFYDYDVWLDDAGPGQLHNNADDNVAEPYFDHWARPDAPLGDFNGEPSAGTWELHICDLLPPANDGVYHRSRLSLSPLGSALSSSGTWTYALPTPAGVDGVTQTLSIQGLDHVGNRTTEPIILDYLLDTVPPALTVTSVVTEASGVDLPAVLVGEVSDSGGLNGVHVRVEPLDGSPYRDGVNREGTNWSYTPRPGRPGTYTLWVQALDEAGNTTVLGPFALDVSARGRAYLPLLFKSGGSPLPQRIYLPLVVKE